MSAPIIKFKFKAGNWRDEIEKVECVGETEKMLTTREKGFGASGKFYDRKRLKISDSTCYFDTWEEAKALLMSRAESKVLAARRSLELANAKLGNIKGMKPPKESA
jgi:hypothetical protein